MSDVRQALGEVSEGFRERYLDYDQLTAQLQSWIRRYPELIHVQSLGETPEGRQLWLASVGRMPQRARPAFWVDANMHAAELCGSNVALALIEDVLSLHLEPSESRLELPPSVADVAREVLFYVMPRVSPDGAEAVLKSGRALRSVPRDTRLDTAASRWRSQDLDGDGLALMLRYQDEAGEFIESPDEPGLMLRRELDDSGPFYQLAVEGIIERYDGLNIPKAGAFDDHFPDLNRNFPWSWAPEPEQEGAGPFPGSEPESRAIIEFASQHPNIFAWADLHTFGGVFIRPLGHAADARMHPSDLALYNQLAAWAQHYTGYPTVSGFEEFTYVPEQPLRGDIVDFAYHQRGALAYTCELWDLFEKLGLGRPPRFAEHYVRFGRREHKQLWHWDREHNQSRIFRPWRPVSHPQLGRVEVGGFDPRIGIWNPPEHFLQELCLGQSQVMLRLAAMAPRIEMTIVERTRLSADLWSARVRIRNLGYLPSNVLESAKVPPLGDPPRLEIIEQGCRLQSPDARSIEIQHLSGWGRGLFSQASSLLSMKSGGSSSTRQLTLVARGAGSLNLRLQSPRLGIIETTVTAPS